MVGEDNAVNQQIAIELLESAGVAVEVANNGREVIEKLLGPSGSSYHAVLMDLQMPGMDGFEATRRIREDSRFKDLPIIAMTAHAMTEVREQCLAVGMNDHVVKPIHPETLFETLARWCAGAKREVAATGSAIPTVPLARTESGAEIVIAGVDTAGGLARMAGRRDAYIRLLRQFCDTQSGAARDLRETLENKDRETAERIAHTLKGAAGGIGATLLAERSSNLERAIRETVESEEILWLFESELARTISAILAGIELPALSG